MDESPPPAPDLQDDAASGGNEADAPPAWQPLAARTWHAFRHLPWWGQLLGWMLAWWILPAAWLLARARDAGGVLAAGIVALFGIAIVATAVGDDPGSEPPATTATDDETTPTTGLAAPSPTATTSPTPDTTPAGGTRPTPSALATTTAPTAPVTPSPDGSPLAAGPTSDPGATSETGTSSRRDGQAMTVERIVDGDTLYLSGLPERARLIGIDTPETRDPGSPVECFGPEATAHLAELVPPGSHVVVTFDVERIDQYDRPLVYLYRASDDLFVNEAMLADGYAQMVTYPPNVRFADLFRDAQSSAREDGLGLWSADCDEPADDPTTAPPPMGGDGGGVGIATIEYDGPGRDVEYNTSEYVVLANDGDGAVDVGGWSLTDEVGHRIVIPSGYAIAVGGQLRVHTGPGDNTATAYHHGETQAIWNNSGGDTATLRDANGTVVDQFSYSS